MLQRVVNKDRMLAVLERQKYDVKSHSAQCYILSFSTQNFALQHCPRTDGWMDEWIELGSFHCASLHPLVCPRNLSPSSIMELLSHAFQVLSSQAGLMMKVKV